MEAFVFPCRLSPPLVTPQIQFVYLTSLLSLLPFFQAPITGLPLGLTRPSASPTCGQRTLTANVVVMHGTHGNGCRGALALATIRFFYACESTISNSLKHNRS